MSESVAEHMTERVQLLRKRSASAEPSISAERARLITAFYRENDGAHATPVMRALALRHLCENKTIFIDADELIVGERGPSPATASRISAFWTVAGRQATR